MNIESLSNSIIICPEIGEQVSRSLQQNTWLETVRFLVQEMHYNNFKFYASGQSLHDLACIKANRSKQTFCSYPDKLSFCILKFYKAYC